MEELNFLLSTLPLNEQEACKAFKFMADQKRAVVSRLMQRQCICKAHNVTWSEVCIKRTKGRKPFCSNSLALHDAPNFNYNVSHEVSMGHTALTVTDMQF